MAFYKVRKQKVNGLYYPQSVVVGKQISTKVLASLLADRSTVTLADTMAVLSELGTVMSIYMEQGRSVKLDGLGSFRYTINAHKQGVETPEKVNVSCIKDVRVRFIQESTRNPDRSVATRSMQPKAINWMLWGAEDEKANTEGDENNDNTGNEGENGTGSNPL